MIRLKKIAHKKGIHLGEGRSGSDKAVKLPEMANDIENQSVKQKVIDVFSIDD